MKLIFSILLIGSSLLCKSQRLNFKHGTAIVEYWTKDSIWIAADSKEYTSGLGKRLVSKVCKIRNFENIFYTIAGKVQFGNNEPGSYNAYDDLLKLLKTKKPLIDIVDTYEKLMIPKLTLALQTGFYAKYLKFEDFSDMPVLAATLSTINETGPSVIFVVLSVEGTPTNWQIVPSSYNIKSANYLVTGFPNEINYVLDNDKSYFTKKGGVKNKLIALLKIAIKAHPNEVGLPIDILVITKKGHHWVQKNQECL